MNKYRVYWTKKYWASGDLLVKANSEEHAQHIVNLKLGDLEGSMQHDPFQDEIEAVEEEINDA
jgi:hypothetical protein